MIPKLKEFNIVPSKNLDYLGWRQSLKVDDKNPLFTEKVVKIELPKYQILYSDLNSAKIIPILECITIL